MKADRFRAFVDTHYDRLWRVVRRLGVPQAAVEDATQEVLLVLSRRLADVEPGAEWSFAWAAARRVASDARKKEGRRPVVESDAEVSLVVDPRGDRAIAANDDRQLLDMLLDTLSDEYREVVVLVELEGLTIVEVAALLAVPQGTVASRMRRARAQLEEAAATMISNTKERT